MSPALEALRERLRAAGLYDHARGTAAQAPALSPAQRDRVAGLLRREVAA